MGRSRVIGTRLPSFLQVLNCPNTVWQAANVGNWYGQAQCLVEIASDTAVWYHTGLPPVPVRQFAWYRKPLPTFSDVIALIREQFWQPPNFFMSHVRQHVVKVPRLLLSCLYQAACYAN